MAILLNELIEETPDLESINYEKHSPNHETTHHKSIRCLADNE